MAFLLVYGKNNVFFKVSVSALLSFFFFFFAKILEPGKTADTTLEIVEA